MQQNIKFQRSITNHGGSLGMSIPKEVGKYVKIQKGDEVEISACKVKKSNCFVVSKKELE